ncbi:Ricin-type beta-trefoil lectin domain-like [Streptomyces sp. TLI_053]|uniref:RICIN domain-containing protein n=1 Tax=Streptomyces sp. TLI_053 TaxID=1855352 RepID=UPI00087CE76F|nr:RICIN domain-containing protein [Streptomyces sp. TLI_053]SDT82881.1 Ricin-type beta-trefoil lectin domain-like [Streptomyces sp. TLI_053]
MRRESLFAAAAAAAVFTLTATTPASASVPPAGSTVRVEQYMSDRCLVNGGGVSVSTARCSVRAQDQQWTWTLLAPVGPATLANRASGLCLDSDADGTVRTSPCVTGTPSQQWTYQQAPNGAFQLQDVGTGMCLMGDIDGEAFTVPCRGIGTWVLPRAH